MSKRLVELTRRLERTESAIETELRRLRQGCKHKDVIRTNDTGPYLFMCQRCKVEEHGWYLHHMRFAHAADIPSVTRDKFFELRPPGQLVKLPRIGDT